MKIIAVITMPSGGLLTINDGPENDQIATWPTKTAAKKQLEDHHLVRAYGATLLDVDEDGDDI